MLAISEVKAQGKVPAVLLMADERNLHKPKEHYVKALQEESYTTEHIPAGTCCGIARPLDFCEFQLV